MPLQYDSTQTDLVDPSTYTFYNTSGDDSGTTYFMGETAQSGEWIRVGIDGIMYMASAPGSHPSSALSSWTNLGAVSEDTVFDGAIISMNSGLAPWNNMIGAAIHFSDKQFGAPTETWWLHRVAFSPKRAQNSIFN